MLEQFSQISTIKGQNLFNSRKSSKESSKLKYSQKSNIKSQSESLNIEKLLTSIDKKKQSSFELSSINYIPVTNMSHIQQRRLNGTANKTMKNSFCTAILNTTNPSLAIQSQPNSMLVGFSSYFDNQSLDYDSIVCLNSDDQKLGARTILKFIINVENRSFTMRVGFLKIKKYAKESTKQYVKSLQIRQPELINLVLKKREDNYWHEKTHDKIGLPFYNKLMGLCAAELVANKKLQLIEKNVDKLRILKQSSVQQVLKQSQVTQNKYKFNFQIMPSLPLHFEKKANEQNMKTSKKNN